MVREPRSDKLESVAAPPDTLADTYSVDHLTREGFLMSTQREVARHGISFGSALAIAISWSQHHSILWAIVQGIFSWFYVLYYAITR